MKARLFAVASGTIESGGGIVISSIWSNLLWLGWLLIAVGVISLILGLAWNRVVSIWKWLQVKAEMGFRITRGVKEANRLLATRESQGKSPGQWLHPVIEIIDLNRQGSSRDDNDVYFRFQIDSKLLFPMPEFYVWVRLELEKPATCQRTESEWYAVPMPQKHPALNSLTRYSFGDRFHLKGETFQEKTMQQWMSEFRTGTPLLAMLSVKLNMSNNEQDAWLLERNGPRYMAPANDYREA